MQYTTYEYGGRVIARSEINGTTVEWCACRTPQTKGYTQLRVDDYDLKGTRCGRCGRATKVNEHRRPNPSEYRRD